ncbi:hypothetical protein PZ892_07280 [Sphingobacterium sp. WM]|uniref:hypothetical protein n=1 Tax=Sphingobacterium sp. WM TaxID=3031802 RepID=UPI00240D2539|nr:hypothetical protein [Sphingobacterium sp. WM]WFB65008.1 hypothetical protein PZ892_07280 [Sphingobacterium sp. WM]
MNNNNIIEDYLSSKGISPARKYRNYSMYHAPYRKDRTPSMKVQGDVFMDFGTGVGGGLKKLKELMNEVETLFIPKLDNTQVKSSAANRKIKVLAQKTIGTNPILNKYLLSRYIDIDVAGRYCTEVYYSNGTKSFFAIGLPTVNENSFSVRNKFFKGKIGSGESYFKHGYDKLQVFEGMFSMLSYFQKFNGNDHELLKGDVLVLNSINNAPYISKYADNYKSIQLFLDRDNVSMNATKLILEEFPHAFDFSIIYDGYVDLNESLVAMNKMIEALKRMNLNKGR